MSSSSPKLSRIASAILGQTCPICLRHIEGRSAAVISVCMHAFCIDCIRKWSRLKRKCPLCNSDFDSLFFKISLSSRTFRTERLPDLNQAKIVNNCEVRRRRDHLAQQRVIRRARDELIAAGSRTRASLSRRSFGRPGSVAPDVVAERVLQWRASIYERELQAIPFSPGNSLCQEKILHKIEPWIRRELRAVLGDPDPSVIVHVATSVFKSRLEKERTTPSQQSGVKDDFLAPLRSFLHERTDMFWHELRCFAESPFAMETYDTVVEY